MAVKPSEEGLRAALRRAKDTPADDAAWSEAETIAAELGKSEEVAALYLRLLKGKPPRALVAKLAQRAVRLHEEWLGAEPDALITILELALTAEGGLDWAFERLTLILSAGQRWNDLLAVYDRVLGQLPDGARRRALLNEAAGVAKDFVGDIDRAIGYLDQLFRARPNDAQVAASLERLLERQGAWDALARAWQTRLPLLVGAEARELRERAAALYLDKLGDVASALQEAKRLLESGGDDVVPTGILERILGNDDVPPAVRSQALDLLRAQHEKMGRDARVVDALRVARKFVAGEDRAGLLRETAERLAGKGDTAGAMEQLVELMALAPDDAPLRARLANLAAQSGAHDVQVRGLLAAAKATSDPRLRVALTLEAAHVHEERLGRPDEAIELYRRVVTDEAADPGSKLAVLRRLVDLLGEKAGPERLEALEQVAELERGAGARRAALGEAARLAATLGMPERAAAAWQRRLALDPSDREALDALVEIAAQGQDRAALIAALRSRVAAPGPDGQRRADLVRIAELEAQGGDAEAALATWRDIEQRFGEDASSTTALRGLLEQAGRWPDLMSRLARTGEADAARLAELCQFLGQVSHQHLGDAIGAVLWYERSLRADPRFERARQGLRALVSDGSPDVRAAAVAALVKVAEETEDWGTLLELSEARLALTADGEGARRARLHLEAAEIAERRTNDPVAALRQVAAALRETPADAWVLAELLRLAGSTAAWVVAAEALEGAVTALAEATPERSAQLGILLGQIREERLGDREGALAAYDAALRSYDTVPARTAVVRLAAGLGRWVTAVEAALGGPPELAERELVPLLERSAGDSEGGLAALGEALSAAVARRPSLPRPLARELELRVAGWLARGGDPAGESAAVERALARASIHDPQHLPTLEKLAEVQRARPGRPLYDTLTRIAALAPGALAPLVEAAELASASLGDEALARSAWRQVLDRAIQQLAGGPSAPAESAALRAVDVLVALHLAADDRAEARRAIDLLLDLTRLPLAPESVRGALRRAGRIAREKAADGTLAREIYRRLLELDPDDREGQAGLAALYEEGQQYPELLAMRKRALAQATAPDERLGLRLEIARLGALIEAQSGRVPTLLANLEEAPGHEPTLAALGELLRAHGRHGELADVLTAQARRLDEAGQAEGAARLWGQVAALAEEPLRDRPRAIAAHERVAALVPSPDTLDALSRLYLACGESMTATSWLEQRLSATGDPDERVAISRRLADAYVAAGQRHRAVATLERAQQERPESIEVRTALVGLYRAAGSWEPLAAALAEVAGRGSEPEAVLAAAREAATIQREKLGRPERAIPVLTRALEVAPDDRGLRTTLAECLRAAGKPAEARAVLQPALDAVGRRRSRERATLHQQMALAARAEGDLKLALEHLDQAAAIALDDMGAQLALAEVAEEAGELARAEQAYRSLLVLARRGDPAEAPLAAGEVLLRLEKLARARGQSQAAAECFDSALAIAMQSPGEARRLQKALLGRGDADATLALLERRRLAAGNAVEEARIAVERGAVLAELGREQEALDLYLRALEKIPESADAHAQARQLAHKLGQSPRYLDALMAALEQRRRWDDGPRVAELLLRAAEVAERDLGDARAAASHYARAEQIAAGSPEPGKAAVEMVAPAVRARIADALVGLARVSAGLGDTAEEAGALERLQRLAGSAATPAEKGELLYRLAERQLASGGTRAAGLATLTAALDAAPDFGRALALVREANLPEEELPQVMPLYERVARSSGDDRMLLDYLARRALGPQANQAEVREAVELALALGERARADLLLERAVALGREKEGGLREASWALVELAQRRRTAGDLDTAARLLEEGREVSANPRVLSGLRDIAREAARQGKTALAARILERLRDAYPADREIWQPLLELYGELGDRPSMERLVAETTAKLLDRKDRNLVRMAWARFLLGQGDTGDKVAAVLRDVLLDDPAHPEAVMVLADLHERRGDVGEAVALLSEALRETEAQGDDTRRAALVRRLAELVNRADPAQAKQVYRTALAAPFAEPALKRSLQAGLVDLLVGEDEAGERAALMEEILAGESGDEAAGRALALVDLRTRLGDDRGARRALELGRMRAPGNRALFDRLFAIYEQSGRWRELIDLLIEDAGRLVGRDPGAAARLLRQGARLRRERLEDAAGAAELLRQAGALNPGDDELMREMAATLLEINRWDLALEEVTRALATPGLPAASRVGLLRLRAELRASNGEDGHAVADLEEAFALGGNDLAVELGDALARYANRAAVEGQLEGERAATLRLAEVLSLRGDAALAQEVLFRWVETHPDDHEALRVLRQRFEADGRWDEAAQVCVRLLEIEQGEAKVDATMALAEACERLGRPGDAIPTVESVLEEFPGHRPLLARLVRLFQLSGNGRKAGTLMVDIADHEGDDELRFQALTEAADLLLREGDPQAAFAALEKAVALKPKDRLARRLLADASLSAGLYQEAAEVLGGLLAEKGGVAPSETALLYHRLGRASAGLGDTPAQMQALKRALDADRRNGDVASELADLAEHMGDYDLALRALRAITLHAPNGPVTPAMAFYRQARIVHRQGDRPRALIFTKRALQEDPELGVARQFLQELN